MQLAIQREKADLDRSSDEELVELARGGGENAIRALIKRNNQRLFRVARAVVRDDGEAEDIVQEAYVRAFTKLHSFRGDSSFSTWLTRIALNEALGRARRRRPSAPLAELDTIAADPDGGRVIMFPMSLTPPSADAELSRRQARELLELAVDDLPDPFRLVFVLREIEELSVNETANQLSLKPETVKSRLHRARGLMRAAIEKRLSASFSEIFPFDGARCARIADEVVERLQRYGGGAKCCVSYGGPKLPVSSRIGGPRGSMTASMLDAAHEADSF
jgi:RNA polymerase sigma-70 factor (ECF subfamily)